MKFGICTSFREVQALEEITFDYLEESVQRFLIPEKPHEDFADRLRDARNISIPIEAVNSFLPADLFLVETPQQPIDRVRIQRYVQTALQRAEQVGIHVIVFGSGAARKSPPGYNTADATRQILDHLATWSGWARNHGVTIVLEPLQYAETNTFNTVAESGAAVSTIVDSGAKLLADTYHMACNDEDPATIVPWSSLLTHVHVAEQQDRAAPGTHGEDFRPYFSALHRANYDQRISIECRWRNFVAEVGPAIAVLEEQWATSA